MKYSLTILALVLSWNCLAQRSDGSALYDPAFHQLAVARQGDTLRYADLRKFIRVNPSTRYHIGCAEGCRVEVKLYDNARDPVAAPEPRGGDFDFVTPPGAYYLRWNVSPAAKPGAAFLTQISDAGVCEVIQPVLAVRKLPAQASLAGEGFYRIAFDVSWRGRARDGIVLFTWYDGDRVVDRYRCIVRGVAGIEPQWDGIRVEWRRQWLHSPDGISMRLGHHYNTSPRGGKATIRYEVESSSDVDRLTVQSEVDGGLSLRNLVVTKVGPAD